MILSYLVLSFFKVPLIDLGLVRITVSLYPRFQLIHNFLRFFFHWCFLTFQRNIIDIEVSLCRLSFPSLSSLSPFHFCLSLFGLSFGQNLFKWFNRQLNSIKVNDLYLRVLMILIILFTLIVFQSFLRML